MVEGLLGTPLKVESRADLCAFMAGRAAFVSQKAMFEYCRARAGVMWDKLMLEADFVAGLERGRWQAYVAALADLALVCDVAIRAGGCAPQPAALGDVAAEVLGAEPRLAQAGVAVAPEVAAIRLSLDRAAMAPPRRVHEIAVRAGGRIYALMPIHPDMRRHDETTIVNNVRFLMVRAYEDLAQGLDPARLGAELGRAARDGA
ncbi:MAG: hypothetical protein R3F55_06390 [Alphaproteobacteria bacterium]